MNIQCPKCGFSRDVPKERLPGKNVIATCPRCGERFSLQMPQGTGAAPDNSEEEDIRVVASRAYQREAERFEREAAGEKKEAPENSDINPWDTAPGRAGWLASFYQTVLRVMFAAPFFFSHLKPKTGLGKAVAFFLIVSVFHLIMQHVWGNILLASLPPAINDDPQLEQLLKLLASRDNFLPGILVDTAILVLQLYVFTLLLFLAYRLLAPGKATFALLFQIVSYSSAPSLLCVIPVLGAIAGMFWSLGCLLSGCRAALGLDWARTVTGFLPILFLVAPIFIQAMQMVGK